MSEAPRFPEPHVGRAAVTRAPFGATPEGDAELFTLANAHGLVARVTSFGGIVVSLLVPDRDGRCVDVVLGYDALEGYLRDTHYIGVIAGRHANRIANARFAVDGTTYQLAANHGPHHLHGGFTGFGKALWQVAPLDPVAAAVTLSYTSRDGEEGYPGTLQVRVRYALTDRNELAIDYLATTDRPTPVNLTQHSYFNLAGEGDVLGHQLQISAEAMTPVDPALIPTGEIRPVAGGPFDFRELRSVGGRMSADDEQLHRAGGYDHNFVLRGHAPRHAARLVDPRSGRALDVHTTEPGLQLYAANGFDGRVIGKGGVAYRAHAGLCLETQHFPDAPNQPGFASTILRPGTAFRSRTLFAFGVAA